MRWFRLFQEDKYQELVDKLRDVELEWSKHGPANKRYAHSKAGINAALADHFNIAGQTEDVIQSCQCFRFYRKTPDFTTQFTIVQF